MKINFGKYLVFCLMTLSVALAPRMAMAGGDPGPQIGGNEDAGTEAGLTDPSLKKCKACAAALKNTAGGNVAEPPDKYDVARTGARGAGTSAGSADSTP